MHTHKHAATVFFLRLSHNVILTFIFTLNILPEYDLQRTFMTYCQYQGYLTERTPEKETMTEKEKHKHKMGRNSDSKLYC